MSSRLLIRGGCVLTLGAKTRNFAEADVLIEDGKIAEVGQGLRGRDAEVVDASDTIVMPGFVDTHRHTWETLFRNAGDVPGSDRTTTPAAIYGPHHRPDDVYAATLIGLLGAVEAGITTVVDWSDIQSDDDYTEAALQAHIDSGLRTVLVHALPHWTGAADDAGPALERLVARSVDLGPTTTLASGPPDPHPEHLERAATDWGRARALGLHIHAHIGGPSPGTVAALHTAGLLDADVTLIHCTRCDGADLDAVASSGAGVALTPSTEMATGPGSPPIQALVDRNIRPGLGVDNERMAPGDIFAQMRVTISLQHAAYFDLKLAGKAGLPNLLTTRHVLRYATSDGARSVGLGEVTGSLEPGRQADIILLRTDVPNIAPVNDPIGAVVWGMDSSNIDSVFVAGRALLRGGSPTADVVRARTLANEAHRRVTAASGLMVGIAGGGPQ